MWDSLYDIYHMWDSLYEVEGLFQALIVVLYEVSHYDSRTARDARSAVHQHTATLAPALL